VICHSSSSRQQSPGLAGRPGCQILESPTQGLNPPPWLGVSVLSAPYRAVHEVLTALRRCSWGRCRVQGIADSPRELAHPQSLQPPPGMHGSHLRPWRWRFLLGACQTFVHVAVDLGEVATRVPASKVVASASQHRVQLSHQRPDRFLQAVPWGCDLPAPGSKAAHCPLGRPAAVVPSLVPPGPQQPVVPPRGRSHPPHP
jgi:hypothetical protein